MFKEIPAALRARMEYLEALDKKDRTDGTEMLKRLRQIPPETGKFIALLAACGPEGDYIEIGTSAGYSSLWLWLALKGRGIKLRTYEILPEKVVLAKETFRISGVSDDIDLIEGDFLEFGPKLKNVAFCFLDCEKHLYEKCYDLVSSRLVPGALLVADNAVSHHDSIKAMMEKALHDKRFDCLTVPIGKGLFLCRRVSRNKCF